MEEGPEFRALKIGPMARRFGLNVRTLRYYEAIGLLGPTARTEGGYRMYTAADEHRLRLIQRAKSAGFQLEEIRALIEVEWSSDVCDVIHGALARHLSAIDGQIAELLRQKAALTDAAEACEAMKASGEGTLCPLMERWHRELTSTPETEAVVEPAGTADRVPRIPAGRFPLRRKAVSDE